MPRLDVSQSSHARRRNLKSPTNECCSAQAFIRAHAADVVGWGIVAILSPDDNLMQPQRLQPQAGRQVTLINWGTAGFHDVIGKYFVLPQGNVANAVVHYRDLRVERGHFWASQFTRFFTDVNRQHQLPYRVLPPNPGAPGNTAGRGGGAAGAGRGALASGRGGAGTGGGGHGGRGGFY